MKKNAKYLDTNILFTVRMKDLATFNLVKLACGGLALDMSQFLLLTQLHQKNDAHFKSG